MKENDNLTKCDWRSPINFVLACQYGWINYESKEKEKITQFLDDDFVWESIGDMEQPAKSLSRVKMQKKKEKYTKGERVQ